MKKHQGKIVEGRGANPCVGTFLTKERAEEYLEPMVECNMNMLIAGVEEPLLSVAHEAGLEFHTVFGAVTVPAKSGESHPWRQVSAQGYSGPLGHGSSSGCPSNKELREYHIEKLVQTLREYPELDGVLLDGIWFDAESMHGPYWLMYCYCDQCRSGFKKDHGVDPIEIAMDSEKDPALTEAWKRWRAEVANKYAREIKAAMKEVNPNLILWATAHMTKGADPLFTEPYVCSQHFQEWGRWLAEGTMEIFFPMPYTVDNAGWRQHLKLCREAEEKTGGKGFTYPSVGVPYLAKGEQLREQIELAREAGVGGVTLFHWGTVIERNYLKYLKQVWSEPAIPPHQLVKGLK